MKVSESKWLLKEELARVKREGNEMTVEEMRKKIREIEEMKVELDKEIKELQLKQTVQTTIDNKYITGAFIAISYTDEEDHEVYGHNFYVNKVQAVEVLKRLVGVSND